MPEAFLGKAKGVARSVTDLVQLTTKNDGIGHGLVVHEKISAAPRHYPFTHL